MGSISKFGNTLQSQIASTSMAGYATVSLGMKAKSRVIKYKINLFFLGYCNCYLNKIFGDETKS